MEGEPQGSPRTRREATYDAIGTKRAPVAAVIVIHPAPRQGRTIRLPPGSRPIAA